MKKIVSLLMLTSLLLMSACSANNSPTPAADTSASDTGTEKYKIGITQIVEHPSLDDARLGFEEELKAQGIEAEIIYKNAQGDMATATSIAQSFFDENVDLIYAISTPSAQAAKQVSGSVPIVFSAVTDPVKSELEGENITGVSDRNPIKEQLQLFGKLQEGIQKIGIIYSTSETNSQIQVEESKEAAKELGLEIVEVGITNINDMPQGVDALIGHSDAIYVITDNLVAKSIELLTEKANEAKKVLVLSYQETSEAAKNILISNGVSYVDFGKQAGEMAAKILKDGVTPSSIPVAYATTTYNTVSMKVVRELGIDESNPIIAEASKIEE